MMRPESSDLIEKSKADFNRGDFSHASEGFRSALTMLEENGSALEIAEVKNNLGVCLARLSDFQGSLDLIIGTDQVFAEAQDFQRQGIALANIANAHEGLKQYDEAAAAYEKAVECFHQSGDKKLSSITLHALSDLQLKSGKKYAALGTLQASYLEKPEAKLTDKVFRTALGQMIKKLLGN